MHTHKPYRVGEIIRGRYRLISPLGEGGFGVAYRAWDSQAGLPVVLKMPLAKHLMRPVVIDRFGREVIRLRECNHQHIVPIIDDGLDDHGRPYLAMRFLPGGSLAHRRKPAVPTTLHRWLPAIASALDYTHSMGVLHRDVKPANIFFDTQSRAYLGDFGIAKLAEDQNDADDGSLTPNPPRQDREDSLTMTGGLIGTSVYMAPEVFHGRPQPSRQSDQYSLAVTVYEMLSGKFPCMGSYDDLRVLHQSRQSTPLADRIKGLPLSLYAAVNQSLSKQPDHRFRSCQDFASAVLAEVPLKPLDPLHHRFLCPACQRLVRVPQDFGGRACRCPDCKAKLMVSPNADALWREEEAFVLGQKKQNTLDSRVAAFLVEDQQLTRSPSQRFSESRKPPADGRADPSAVREERMAPKSLPAKETYLDIHISLTTTRQIDFTLYIDDKVSALRLDVDDYADLCSKFLELVLSPQMRGDAIEILRDQIRNASNLVLVDKLLSRLHKPVEGS